MLKRLIGLFIGLVLLSPFASADRILEEIVVVAEKRDENLKDLSQAVTVLSGEELDQKNITTFVDLSAIAPGVTVAKNEGYKKIGEKIVNHRPRKYGKTKFGPSRFLYGFLDLLTIWFISSFGKRPMHLFGSLGLILITTGFLFAAYLGYDKIILNPGGRLITERPEFYISLVTMIIGSQFFSMGFIGELMLKSINQKPCLLYTSPSPRDGLLSRMPSSA